MALCLNGLAIAAGGSERTTQHDMRRNLNEQTPTFPVGKSYDEILDPGGQGEGIHLSAGGSHSRSGAGPRHGGTQGFPAGATAQRLRSQGGPDRTATARVDARG